MKIEMKEWRPEVVNTAEENHLLIKGVAAELSAMGDEGAQSVLLGGDTLIFGAIDGDGQVVIYECTIRRANVGAVDDLTPVETGSGHTVH